MQTNDTREGMPPVDNDPGHPLRRFLFSWREEHGHIDARTWIGYRARDEFHGLERIVRVPRGRPMLGLKPRAGEIVVTERTDHYRFDDDGAGGPAPTGSGPLDALTYEEMIDELVRRHGEHVRDPQSHPLAVAWRAGEDIEWEPAPSPFPVGTSVRRHGRQFEEDAPGLAARQRERVGRVVQAHALFSRVDFGGERGPTWVANRLLETAPALQQPTEAGKDR